MPVKSTAITVLYFAEDVSAGGGKTGDVGNHTLRRITDGTAGTIAASPAEVDATNLPGWYSVALASGENAGIVMAIGGKSSTANVVIRGMAWTNEHNMTGISDDKTAADNAESFFDGTGYAGTGNTIPTVTNLTNLPSIPANWLTAAGTAADFGTELATAIWTDTTAGDFTVALSIGKSIMNGVSLGTGLTVARCTLTDTLTTYTGNTVQTGDSYAIVNSGTFGNAAIKGYVDDIGVAGAGLTAIPWNAAWDAEVQSEVDDALVVQRLDELLNADSDIDGAAPPTVGSVFHELMTKTAGSFTFDQATDSLEAIRDRGDAAWITATGFSTLTQADVRTAVGLASANLDTQLAAIDDYIDTEVAAIKAKTDNLPASPAAVGSAMTLTSGERDAVALAHLKYDLSTVAGEADKSPINALRKLRLWSLTAHAGKVTVYKEDGTTEAYQDSLTTDATATPITSISE